MADEAQDLSSDPLLQGLPRVDAGGKSQPVLGGITLLARIGAGVNGSVYRGLSPTLNRHVAVKVCAVVAGNATERFQQFMADVNAAKAVKSPRVVEVLDAGTNGNLFFAVMGYVAGKSAQAYVDHLRERLKPGMTEATALDVCIAAAEGLAAAHGLNQLHRDVRPSAVMIPFENDEPDFTSAKLADLGLAHSESSGRILEGTAAESGTPGFLSPEQAIGARDLGKTCDVFSLGATLYALLVGQPPFGGLNLDSVLSSTVSQEAADIRTWRPDVSRATGKLIEICLSKSPSARFSDAAVLAAALRIARAKINDALEGQNQAIADIAALVQAVDKEPSSELNAPVQPEPVPAPASGPRAVEGAPTLIKANVDALNETLVPTDDLIADLLKVKDVSSPVQAAPVSPPKDETASEPPKKEDAPVPAPQAAAEWVDPTQVQAETAKTGAVPPRGNRLVPLLAAAVLLIAALSAVAWQMGYLKKLPFQTALNAPAVTPAAPLVEPVAETAPAVVPQASEPEEKKSVPAPAPATPDSQFAQPAQEGNDKALGEPKAREELRATEIPANFEQAAETKMKTERERLAAMAVAKEKEQAEAQRLADAKAAAQQALEAKANLDKLAEAKRASEAAAEAEQARLAAQTEARRAAEQARIVEEQKRASAASFEKPAPAPDASRPVMAEQKAHGIIAAIPQVELPRETVLDLGEGVRMEMVLVPAGSFMMGTGLDVLTEFAHKAGAKVDDYLDETPAHKVSIERFYIARTPVTVAQFRRFASATSYVSAAERKGEGFTLKNNGWQRTPGACWSKPGFAQDDTHPAVMLSYWDCEKFAAWAQQQSRRPLRLPTEAEWEYAARGPENNIYPWGNRWDGKLCNHSDKRLREFCTPDWSYSQFDDGFAFTSPVDAYRNMSWSGILDMAGNVFQWCSDVYEPYRKAGGPQIILDPADVPRNAIRVLRGGSYLFRPVDCRSAARRHLSGNAWSAELGMRLVFSADK